MLAALFNDPQARRRAGIIGLPGIGNGDGLAILDIHHPQHRDPWHPAHGVKGGALAIDQPFIGHIAQQRLELNLLLPLEPESLGNFALAHRIGGGRDQIEDLLRCGQAGGEFWLTRHNALWALTARNSSVRTKPAFRHIG